MKMSVVRAGLDRSLLINQHMLPNYELFQTLLFPYVMLVK